MIDFKLPSLGADMDKGKFVQWLVKPGDPVKRGQVIAVVETSKAAVDVECWQEGTVSELLTRPGENVPVGAVMARLIGAGGSAVPSPPMGAAAGKVPPPPATPAQSRPAAVPTAAAAAPSSGFMQRKPASPAARKHARELDVDIESISGTGPHGSVTLADVEAAAARKAAPAPAPATAPAPADRRVEMRKVIAAAMSRSKREIPHYYLAEQVPMRAATEWLLRKNAGRPVTERILMGALQLKAVALTLRRFPEFNGYWLDSAFQPSADVHPGVAISIRQGGLIAPAIHAADSKSLDQLMAELSDLVRRARAGSLRSSEIADPTITVTNLGEQGVETVFGVIYPPQVALVGFGRVAERPWAEDGALRAMPVVTASLAADHRVSDGHRGGLFLAALREQLQHPEEL